MKFRPLHDRVVVRRLEEEQKTKGGIIIPDTAAEKPQTGEVIAAGPGARGEDGKLQPMGVKAGDKVLFGKWSGTEVKIDGTPHHEGVRHHGDPRLIPHPVTPSQVKDRSKFKWQLKM
jgi:chaperonin GroES